MRGRWRRRGADSRHRGGTRGRHAAKHGALHPPTLALRFRLRHRDQWPACPVSQHGDTPIHQAARKNNLTAVKHLLAACPEAVTMQTNVRAPPCASRLRRARLRWPEPCATRLTEGQQRPAHRRASREPGCRRDAHRHARGEGGRRDDRRSAHSCPAATLPLAPTLATARAGANHSRRLRARLQGWRLGGGGGDVGSPLGADRTPRGATQLAALTTATASQRRRRVDD